MTSSTKSTEKESKPGKKNMHRNDATECKIKQNTKQTHLFGWQLYNLYECVSCLIAIWPVCVCVCVCVVKGRLTAYNALNHQFHLFKWKQLTHQINQKSLRDNKRNKRILFAGRALARVQPTQPNMIFRQRKQTWPLIWISSSHIVSLCRVALVSRLLLNTSSVEATALRKQECKYQQQQRAI